MNFVSVYLGEVIQVRPKVRVEMDHQSHVVDDPRRHAGQVRILSELDVHGEGLELLDVRAEQLDRLLVGREDAVDDHSERPDITVAELLRVDDPLGRRVVQLRLQHVGSHVRIVWHLLVSGHFSGFSVHVQHAREVEAEQLPGALGVHDYRLGADVPVDHLHVVVQELQPLHRLDEAVLYLDLVQLRERLRLVHGRHVVEVAQDVR